MPCTVTGHVTGRSSRTVADPLVLRSLCAAPLEMHGVVADIDKQAHNTTKSVCFPTNKHLPLTSKQQTLSPNVWNCCTETTRSACVRVCVCCVCVCLFVCVRVCVCVCVCVYVCVCVCVCVLRECVCVVRVWRACVLCVCLCVCACGCVSMCIRVYMCVCLCVIESVCVCEREDRSWWYECLSHYLHADPWTIAARTDPCWRTPPRWKALWRITSLSLSPSPPGLSAGRAAGLRWCTDTSGQEWRRWRRLRAGTHNDRAASALSTKCSLRQHSNVKG